MALIDQFLLEYHFTKTYCITIAAPTEKVYQSILDLDISKSLLIRILLRLRGMPVSNLTLQELEHSEFLILIEHPGCELLLGLAGQFWKLKGNMHKVDSVSFTSFKEPGFAKAVWNFHLSEIGENITELSTETRIYCTDRKSYCLFRLYWFLIGPFSGWIRRKMLSIVKTEAEKQHSKLPQPARKGTA